MQIKSLQWLDASQKIMRVVLSNGLVMCCGFPSEAWADEVIQSTIDSGMPILSQDPPPPPTKDETDAIAAKQYQKAQALFAMSPAQVSAWIDANINTFADAKDALKTLAIIVSVLGRRL